jgi:hypothetical protein
MNKILLVISLYFTTILSAAQVYELALPLKKGDVPRDEYGNVVYMKDWQASEYLYLPAADLTYILKRGDYQGGILLGSFNINDRLSINNVPVNTTWTPSWDRYYMKAVREEDGRAESYTIMKSDLKDLNSNRDY